ncbi:MAG: type III secretion inner membrane ring lipoprotein SctJ [Gammaproteobacteria bacterium]|nr:type III secretion inner membrane ring lipoprotein SctJ [Gammaproteobacteria bacterium]
MTVLLTSCETALYENISEQEANEMVSVLMRNNIVARKQTTKGLSTVMVEEADFAQAVELLNQAGFPREQFSGIGDVFKKEGLISSPVEERARYMFALQQELANTINEIDGVLSARVHIVVPEASSPLQEAKPSRAAVLIRHRPGVSLEHMTSKIKMLVTNSVEGLVYDKVSVTWNEARPLESGLQSASGGDLVKVMGAWVHPSSASSLRFSFSLLGFLSVAGVLFSVYLYWALTRAERQVNQFRKVAMAARNHDKNGIALPRTAELGAEKHVAS